jgi:hypothetical protein
MPRKRTKPHQTSYKYRRLPCAPEEGRNNSSLPWNVVRQEQQVNPQLLVLGRGRGRPPASSLPIPSSQELLAMEGGHMKYRQVSFPMLWVTDMAVMRGTRPEIESPGLQKD